MVLSTDPYQESVDRALHRIRTILPHDLAERFQDHSGLDGESFHAIVPGERGPVCGVDGSSAMILQGGSLSIAAFRAGRSVMEGTGCERRLTPLLLSLIGPETENPDFPLIYWECFEHDPLTPLQNEDTHGPISILRENLEYWVASETVDMAASGSLLLLDGALRVSHASHDPVLQRIIATARTRGIHLAAVTKRTEAVWGGGIPLLPAVEGLASRERISSPWWIRIETSMLDHMQFRQWQHGDLYVVKLHPRSMISLKLELPRNLEDVSIQKTMDLMAGCSDDGRLPGYPYPLLDAHRAVVIDPATVDRVRQDLLRGMTGNGYSVNHFQQLFGDVHDEFRKY